MWTFLMMVVLLDLNRATAVRPELRSAGRRIRRMEADWNVTGRSSISQVLVDLDQLDASTMSTVVDTPQLMTSSSSSSSSSSLSSESSQSSEGVELQQQLEPPNMENTALEQLDSSEESSELRPPLSLRHHQLVSLGEGGAIEEGGAQKSHSTEVGGANTNELVGGAKQDEGVASKEKLLDDSLEQVDHLPFHLHDDHSEEAGLELAL
ncbi:uncharacterized protein LOC112141489 [Oryzias melastigma]|uniref:uncharacterized protein LOC112141489 n=1 Tax=Oryzias melastigma TaxID=30732 RepID=UPI000CF7FB67|nr:uncharacterized protein LOC112141489 [Oryzias melastigma]